MVPSSRPVVAALALMAAACIGLGSPGPVGAADPGPTTPPPTSAPPSSQGQPPVPGGGPAPTTTVPADQPTPDDPAAEEPAGEEVPDSDETVPPPPGRYGDQGDFQPQEVLWSSVREAERKLSVAQQAHDDVVDRLRLSRQQRKQLDRQLSELDDQTVAVVAELAEAEDRLVDRAVDGFVASESVNNEIVGTLDAARYERVQDIQISRTFLGAALDADDLAIADYLAVRAQLETRAAATVDGIHWLDRAIAAGEDEALATADAVDRAADELDAFRAGSSIYISGVVFPVAQPYGVPLIDSWGFPRMPGTPDEHWHEGIDIFAPAGTPLVAAERGVVTRVGSGRLGGLTVWLRGESGAEWYYAHLQAHAPGLTPGQVVEAGDLLGWVGNTGNAASTPSHLHLQVHPGGGDPVNPYPLLKVVSDRDLAGR